MPRLNGIDPITIVGTRTTATDPVIDLGTTGNRIDFDTDGDTSIRASADDVLMFEVGGSDLANLSATEWAVTGNLRLGAISTFGTTEPVSWLVMKAGTAPAGAITASGGIGTDGTVVQKIIADGTVSSVQT